MERGAWWATVHGSQRVGQAWVTNTFTFPFPGINLKIFCLEFQIALHQKHCVSPWRSTLFIFWSFGSASDHIHGVHYFFTPPPASGPINVEANRSVGARELDEEVCSLISVFLVLSDQLPPSTKGPASGIRGSQIWPVKYTCVRDWLCQPCGVSAANLWTVSRDQILTWPWILVFKNAQVW